MMGQTDVKTKKPLFVFSRKHLCIPYGVFLAFFVVVPLLLILFYAFTDQNGAISFENFIKFFSSNTTLVEFWLAAIAAMIPAGPPPITAMSYSSILS